MAFLFRATYDSQLKKILKLQKKAIRVFAHLTIYLMQSFIYSFQINVFDQHVYVKDVYMLP